MKSWPLVFALLPAQSHSAFVPLPGCPTDGKTGAWIEYLSTPRKMVGIEFRYAKQVNDPAAMGNVPTNVCYVGLWSEKKHWITAAIGQGPKLSQQPGNLFEYEINVGGHVFLFTTRYVSV